jgi:hypothetical protein
MWAIPVAFGFSGIAMLVMLYLVLIKQVTD